MNNSSNKPILAKDIEVTPQSGLIFSNNVQNAIQELATDLRKRSVGPPGPQGEQGPPGPVGPKGGGTSVTVHGQEVETFNADSKLSINEIVNNVDEHGKVYSKNYIDNKIAAPLSDKANRGYEWQYYFNQLLDINTFNIISNTPVKVVLTAPNVIKCDGNITSESIPIININLELDPSHIYYCKTYFMDGISQFDTGLYYSFFNATTNQYISVPINYESWYGTNISQISHIFSFTQMERHLTCTFAPIFIDLTDMYGAGHEPSKEKIEKIFRLKAPYPYQINNAETQRNTTISPLSAWQYDFNQIFDINQFEVGESNGVTTTIAHNIIKVKGTPVTLENNIEVINTPIIKLNINHMYYITSNIIQGNANLYCSIISNTDTNINISIPQIITHTSAISNLSTIYIKPQDLNPISCQFSPILIDLTEMFGAGNEPTLTEMNKLLLPKKYYPYQVSRKQFDRQKLDKDHAFCVFNQIMPHQKYNSIKVEENTKPEDYFMSNDGDKGFKCKGKMNTTEALQTYSYVSIPNTIPLNIEHKYYFTFISKDFAIFNAREPQEWKIYTTNDRGDNIVYTNTYDIFLNRTQQITDILLRFAPNTSYKFSWYPMLIDLTKMFGRGLEPTTIQELQEYIDTKQYYEYTLYLTNENIKNDKSYNDTEVYSTNYINTQIDDINFNAVKYHDIKNNFDNTTQNTYSTQYINTEFDKKLEKTGVTYQFNQLLKSSSLKLYSNNGVTATPINGGMKLVGKVHPQYNFRVYENNSLDKTHYYAIMPNFTKRTGNLLLIGYTGDQYYQTGGAKIFNNVTGVNASILIYDGVTIDADCRPNLIDLTRMFGVGNEPKTEAELYKYLVRNTYYPYNDINALAKAVETNATNIGNHQKALLRTLKNGTDILDPKLYYHRSYKEPYETLRYGVYAPTNGPISGGYHSIIVLYFQADWYSIIDLEIGSNRLFINSRVATSGGRWVGWKELTTKSI